MRGPYFLSIMALFLFFICCHDAAASEAGPFQGRIVDAENKRPLEGVVVLMEWRQVHFFAGSTFIDAQETLTDKDGRFHIPGIWILNPWKRLNTEAHIKIYKSGYGSISAAKGQMEGMWDALLEIEWGAPKGTFIWKFENNKPMFMLKKLTMDERKKYSTPGDLAVPDDDYHILKWKWKLLMREINKERRSVGLSEMIESDGFGR